MRPSLLEVQKLFSKGVVLPSKGTVSQKKGIQTTSGSIPIILQVSRLWKRSITGMSTWVDGDEEFDFGIFERGNGVGEKGENGRPFTEQSMDDAAVEADVTEIHVRKDADVDMGFRSSVSRLQPSLEYDKTGS